MARKDTIDALRKQIAALEGRAPRLRPGTLSTHIDALDEACGGWPRPGLSELAAAPGRGRLSLALPSVRALTREGQAVAVIDALGRVYPPGWAGVNAARLLVVQPSPEQVGWAAEQIARSGACPLLLILDPPGLGRAGVRLARACEQGDCAALVLVERSDRRLPAGLRLQVRGATQRGSSREVELSVARRRGAPGVERLRLALPEPGKD